jgi:hypothetical protein
MKIVSLNRKSGIHDKAQIVPIETVIYSLLANRSLEVMLLATLFAPEEPRDRSDEIDFSEKRGLLGVLLEEGTRR